jgi:NDP-sugar pyrophosphorylase family protein
VPYGVVNVENDNIVSIIEKPSYEFFVNAGVYVLNPAVLKYIPEDTFFDMPNLFDMVIKDSRKTLSFPIRDYWLDIGGIDEYKKANDEYSNNFNN